MFCITYTYIRKQSKSARNCTDCTDLHGPARTRTDPHGSAQMYQQTSTDSHKPIL